MKIETTSTGVAHQQIVVATNCLYKEYKPLSSPYRDVEDTDGIRGDLALELINQITRSGVKVVVADGGSSSAFLSELDKFQDKGLTLIRSTLAMRGPQRRSAFEAAALESNCGAILYTQAEKVSLSHYLGEISKPILEDRADIVVLKRDPELFKDSYPEYMWQSEAKVNKTYDWLMRRNNLTKKGESFDWFFGPVAFKNTASVLSIFLEEYEVKDRIKSRIGAQINPEMHSDGHYFPIIKALFNRLRVASLEIPFAYPPMQKANETSPKRIAEFQHRRELDADAYRLEAIHFLAFLRGDKRSNIKRVFP